MSLEQMITATTTTPDYRCPKHPGERLTNLLKGGAGFCSSCNLFVQAAGVEMPELSPEIVAKRATEALPKAKKTGKAKAKKNARAKRPKHPKAAEVHKQAA
jgi:hypothetical protein